MNYLLNRRLAYNSSPAPVSGEGWATKISTAKVSDIFATGLSDTTQIRFSSDGLSFYILNVGTGKLWQYKMPKAYDIANAGNSCSLGVGTKYGFAFSGDGKMLFAAYTLGSIFRWSLSTAWDISSLTDTGFSSYSTGLSSSLCTYALAYNTDKKHLLFGMSPFLICSLSGSDYNVYTSANLEADSISWKTLNKNANTDWQTFDVSPSGHDLFVLDSSYKYVFRYYLPNAWSLKGAYYANDSFYAGAYDSRPTGITFSADGKRMFIIGSGSKVVYSFTLSEA